VHDALSIERPVRMGGVRFGWGLDMRGFVDRVWALCQGHEQLNPCAAQLLTLLSADDVRLLLADTLEPADFTPEPSSTPTTPHTARASQKRTVTRQPPRSPFPAQPPR
jgi:hypothetical protein